MLEIGAVTGVSFEVAFVVSLGIVDGAVLGGAAEVAIEVATTGSSGISAGGLRASTSINGASGLTTGGATHFGVTTMGSLRLRLANVSTLGVASTAALGSCLSISCWSPTGCLLPSLVASVCIKVDDIQYTSYDSTSMETGHTSVVRYDTNMQHFGLPMNRVYTM